MKEIIQFTKELIKIPSQNGINPESKIANFVVKKLKSFGFDPKLIGPKNRPSIICFLKKKGAKKNIWLESCLDTVAVGDLKKWEYPPFEAKIKNNRLYGRGVADSKVGIAIFSYLAKEFFENKDFKANIFLGFDADEQSGDFTGLFEILNYSPKADLCILGYQGISEISIGGRGFLRLKLSSFGQSAHTGSKSKKGINAIHQMIKIINKLLDLPFLKAREKFFEYGSALNVSLINGGVAINIVPDYCEAMIDIRLIRSQDKEQIINEINQKLKNKDLNFKIEIINYQKPFLTNPNHPFILLLKKKAEAILKRKIPLVTSGAGSVGNAISPLGIPVINGFGCECDNVHAPNEWINIKTIPKIFKIYKESLIQFGK